jgi:polyhydroxyalkanoate synthesis regulator phasin
MKKKIINGILLVAMLFATTSAFVSCKDTDADYKSEMDAKYATLDKKLAELQALVSSIKSCNCDMTSINNKIAALEAAIAAIQIPNLDGYLKTADLDAKVQALLADYYTKAQVDAAIAKALEGYAKTSDIPDIPGPGLTQDEVNALIIAALADYAKLTDLPDAGLTQAEIQKLIDDAIAKINTGGLTQDEVQKLIDDAIAKITPPEGLSKDEIQKMIDEALAKFKEENPIPEQITKEQIIEIIKETIETTEADLTVIYLTEVTSISVDKVVNPLFEFSTPFGVNSNVLISFFGEKAKRDIYFPKGAEEPIIYKGEYLTEGIGNAGKLYVTVNPSSVDFTGKTLKLVSTTGNEAPVELTPLVESNEELRYITRGDNAFYETYATISEGNIAKAYFSWEPADKQAFKDQIVDLLKSHGKEDIADMLQAITNLVAGNDVPAYRLQASWGDGYYTYSPANIAAVAIKPLTYAFDLADETEISDTPISELERLETDIVNWSTSREGTRTRAWNWLRKFNRMTNIWLNNINWALQPTMFIDANGEISRPGIMNNYKEYQAGEIKLIPSSWTVELLAPALKKYVVVTSVDGVDVKADDPVNAGLLGKVIPGSVNEIPFTLEPGKTYAIQYSALDYEGNIRTLNYFIKGNKKK